MAKLTILAAILAALVCFIVHCSAYKTTVTTVEIDDRVNPWQPGQEMCQKQLEKVNMKHCEKHVIKKIEQEEEEEDEGNVLTLRGIYRNHHEELKQLCCEQLSQIKDQKCQCLAMQEILLKQSGRLEKKQLREMKKELKNLPNECGMEPLQGCDLSLYY